MLDFYLRIIVNLDEVFSELVIVGFFIIIWRDEVIIWNLWLYGGMVLVNIDEFLVWKLFMIFFNLMFINVGLFGFK